MVFTAVFALTREAEVRPPRVAEAPDAPQAISEAPPPLAGHSGQAGRVSRINRINRISRIDARSTLFFGVGLWKKHLPQG